MKITPQMNGGPLPYGNSKCPACLRQYANVLALGHQLPDGTYICYAYSPQEKPKNPVCTFIFNPDAPAAARIIQESPSCTHLSANTIINPLDILYGDERAAKLQEMFNDGYAAW